jgi:hypothetical protein
VRVIFEVPSVRSYESQAPGSRNHPHPRPLPEYRAREDGPELARSVTVPSTQKARQQSGFGTQQSLVDALAKVYEGSADITEFRSALIDRYPKLERAEWTSNEVPDHHAATRPAPVPVGHLSIDLMQAGHHVEVTYDPATGKLKSIQLIYPPPVRERPRPIPLPR